MVNKNYPNNPDKIRASVFQLVKCLILCNLNGKDKIYVVVEIVSKN